MLIEEHTPGQVLILVPMLNEENFIRRCIQSVKDQTFQNWVMYISDNFSDDASLAIAKIESAYNKKIVIVERKNRVTSDQNWNSLAEFALSKTKSEFVMWLGADDFLENADYLDSMVNQCSKDGIVPSFRNCREDGAYYLNHIFATDCTSESRIINHSRLARNWANVVAIYGLYKVAVFKELLHGNSTRLTEAPESDWWWCFGLHNRFKISSSKSDFYVKTIKENPFYVLKRENNSISDRVTAKIISNLSFKLLYQAICDQNRINTGNFAFFLYTYPLQMLFMTSNKLGSIFAAFRIKSKVT